MVMVTKRDFLEKEASFTTTIKTRNLKMEMSLEVCCLPYAVEKQLSIPLINLGTWKKMNVKMMIIMIDDDDVSSSTNS